LGDQLGNTHCQVHRLLFQRFSDTAKPTVDGGPDADLGKVAFPNGRRRLLCIHGQVLLIELSSQKSRPRIALLVEASRAYGRELLRGDADFARTQVDWSLLHQEMILDSAVPDWMTSSRIDGRSEQALAGRNR
jgi:hypothetical protein